MQVSHENHGLDVQDVVIVEDVFVDGQRVEEVVEELVIIEEYARHGDRPPRAALYRVRIDKGHYEFEISDPTGEQILVKAGKTSAGYKLYQVFRGKQPIPVAPTEHVDLRAHGVERFTTVPKDPIEGIVMHDLRRQFTLPAGDAEYLDTLGLPWEAVREPTNRMLLLIEGWRIPDGYNVPSATVALVIPQGYPDTGIDMVYFSPALSRLDGQLVNNLTVTTFPSGGVWQQWSRHRTAANAWRLGVDDISTHLSLVDDWLRREFSLR